MQVNLFDSDGNGVGGPFDLGQFDGLVALGLAVSQHYALVADTTKLNREIGVEDADEPFLTIFPVKE